MLFDVGDLSISNNPAVSLKYWTQQQFASNFILFFLVKNPIYLFWLCRVLVFAYGIFLLLLRHVGSISLTKD